MKFHPAISIILGIVSLFVFVMMVIIPLFVFNIASKSVLFVAIAFLIGIPLGGFIATYFAKDKKNKIRYL